MKLSGGFTRWKVLVAGLTLSLVLAGCATAQEADNSGGGDGNSGGSGGGDVQASQNISGAGSSFIAPYFSSIFQQFAQDEQIQANYQSIGSSGGRENFINKSVDFGASDAPMSDEELQQAGGNPKHVAVIAGAVVPAYNIEGVDSGLNFTGPVLADIFLGNVTNWSDPEIAKLNPDADLPDSKITVVHRSDGSGTTNIFTSYLAAVSPAWKSGPGAGDELRWPIGVGGDGNEGVSGQVQQTSNSIGYIGLEYAVANDIPYGNVGEEGNFVEPSVETAQAALASASDQIPDDLRITISSLDPSGDGVYPITGLTWMLVRQQMDDLAKCKAVAQTAWYATHDGQSQAKEQNYVPMSDSLVSTDEQFIKGMKAGGQNCYSGS